MKYLLFLTGGFQISDGILTHLLAGNGSMQEANRLMEPIVREGNFLLFKIIGVLFCTLLLWFLYKRFHRLTLIATSSMAVFYGVIIAWNLGVFFTGFNPL
jgi:hypothetical protein